MKSRVSLPLLALGLMSSPAAWAQSGTRGDGDDFHTDPEIIITAPYVRSLDIWEMCR